jgi:alpha,alpha-trehalose phosphorylase
VATWREAAAAVVVPFDRELQVTSQSEGFTRYRVWDFEGTPPDGYPLLLHYPYYLLYSSQVVKQADLVFALYVCGDRFDAAQKRRDFEHYEAITVRDSSLSASIQAIVAAEVGHLDLAHAYFRETALVDLRDLAGTTSDGLHLAALAGAWLVVVAGFGGMRDHGDTLAFAPCLPSSVARACFRLTYRGRLLRVEVRDEEVRYEVLDGEPLDLLHEGTPFRVAVGAPFTTSPRARPVLGPISPPPGREPFGSPRSAAGGDEERVPLEGGPGG